MKRRRGDIAPKAAERNLAVTPTSRSKRRRVTTIFENGVLTPGTSDHENVTTTATATATGDQFPSGLLETDDEDDISIFSVEPRKRRRQRELSHVAVPGPAYPRLAYSGWDPSIPVLSEVEAVALLTEAFEEAKASTQDLDFTYFQLENFSIYRPRSSALHAYELVALDRLSQDGFPTFCFDGYLSFGANTYFVHNVSFKTLTVDGYGELEATHLANQICIQSPHAEHHGVWYKLGAPAKEYARFYNPFVWLARFAKHFVDYLLDHDGAVDVTLSHFREKFFVWLHEQYQDEEFYKWLEVAKLKDFRTTVSANVRFLYKECYSIDNEQAHLCSQPIWQEVGPDLTAIPLQPNNEAQTVVTPYAYNCFQQMYFSEALTPRQINNKAILEKVRQRKQVLRLTPFRHNLQSQPSSSSSSSPSPSPSPSRSPSPGSGFRIDTANLLPSAGVDLLNHPVEAGDVVSVRPDTSTPWGAKARAWYAYVQAVRFCVDRTLLDVLWLYEPHDTTLGKAFYPFLNELFLSDNCSCGKAALDMECVLNKVQVSWFVCNPDREAGLFVRQRFRTVHDEDTYDFVTLCEGDFRCRCDKKESTFDECYKKYAIGDTVLTLEPHPSGEDYRLQPGQVVAWDLVRKRIQLRRFDRRIEKDSDSGARPNELLTTCEVVSKAAKSIIRRCHIRYFSRHQIQSGNIVTPYDKDGTGDHFFLADKEEEEASPTRKTTSIDLPPVIEGWNPIQPSEKRKLIGMGIFCGGGNFDRGLAEGGAVKFKYAVDWATSALHSYRANVRRPETINFFLGSVNDFLGRAMSGKPSPEDTLDGEAVVAQPGDINTIVAGSPCPAFSSLQVYKYSNESLRNASMVASVVSFVDFYVPEYLMLENVVTMTNGFGPDKDQNVFAQIVAALVGLGYQVQQFLIDSWSHGSSQQRSRVFIIASAPGLSPLQPPPHSHSHPPSLNQFKKALGKSSNGLTFGRRRTEFTAFEHVSAACAVADLPIIGDSQAQLCPSYPDHRTATNESFKSRTRMAVVPTRPYGIGLMQAKFKERLGLPAFLSGEPLQYCDRVNRIRRMESSKMYARVYPDRLFPTIVTKLAVGDGIAGRVVHWDQHRVLTVMEARRAQGYLDCEVIVGTPSEQLKIVGNSVDRKVALVLGLALRESWMGDSNRQPNDASSIAHAQPQVFGDNQIVEGDDMEDSMRDNVTDDVGADMEADVDDLSNLLQESKGPRLDDADSMTIDNRTAKMVLQLTIEEIEEVRKEHFKAIRRILESRRA